MAIFTRQCEMMEWSDCLCFFARTQDKGDNLKQDHEQKSPYLSGHSARRTCSSRVPSHSLHLSSLDYFYTPWRRAISPTYT